jgi:hypothetical protein
LDCLNSIVTYRGCDSSVTPLSGLDLMDAPEINVKNIANVATDKDISGFAMVDRLLALSHTMVRNDLLEVMAANKMLLNVTNKIWETSDFKPSTVITANNTERGLTLWKTNRNLQKSLKKMTIHTIYLYPLEDWAGAVVKIYDNDGQLNKTTTYSFDLVANQVNEFDVDYECEGTNITVAIRGEMNLGSSYLKLCAACSGKAPNDCGYTQSYTGGKSVNGREGYGVGVSFSCECDYDKILCGLAKKSIGKLIWLKARMMLLEERIGSNRLSNLVVYGAEQAKDSYNKLLGEYETAWQTFVKSLPSLVREWNGDCITCNGIKSVVVL